MTHSFTPLSPAMLCRSVLLCFALLLAGLTAQAQTIRYVSATGTNPNPASATSWATSTADLQGAINASNANDQVWVATGTFTPPPTLDPLNSRFASFLMKNGVGIYGGFLGSETQLSQRPALNPVAGPGGASQPSGTILSGDIGTPGVASDNSYHVISNYNLNTSALLDGFVITGGQESLDFLDTQMGAGMYNDGSLGLECSPTVRNCSFLNNASSQGGGMCNNGRFGVTNPVVENCLFQGNSSRVNGGGVSNLAIGLTITPRFTNCAFVGNSSTSPGGGMYNAGVNNGNCSPTLINCSFLNNTTGSEGGGMYNNDFQGGRCTPTLINCSFRGNTGSAGQAISNADVLSNVQLKNCVLFGTGGNSTFKRNGGTIAVSNSYLESTITDYTGSPNSVSTTSPFTGAGTQLASGSGAINTGVNSVYAAVGGPPLDLAGNPRTLGTNCTIDMGAYEFQSDFPVGITGGPVAGSVVCPGATVTASVSTSGTVTGSQWYQNGTLLGSQTTATLSLANVAVSASGNYVVVVSGSCNSVTSTAFSLTVNSPPSLSLTPAAVSICAGNSTTLTASGGVSYTFGGPAIAAQMGTQITVNQTGIYTVTAIGDNGCSGTGSATVSLHTATQATLLASSISLCAGGSVTLTAGSGGAAYTFSGPNLNQTGNSPTAVATQSGTYSVVVTGLNGCTASAGVSLTINPDPTAVVTFPNGTTVQGTGVAIITLPPFTTPVLIQASGGSFYALTSVIDRINGYEIRQADSNTTGIFTINRMGLFTLTVTGAGGCQRTVQWVIQQQ